MSNTEQRLSAPIELEEPIVRGDEKIASIRLRKPHGSEMRGLSLVRISQMEIDELRKLTPRISMPTITEQEFDQLEICDQIGIAEVVTDFLLTTKRRAQLSTT